ncbi:MAG: glycosyltransferase [Propionibacteriaceae bacterium]|nr:glycosyltransferase [Micropruina sp.]HBX80013.1 bi-functional transferase/deacetylase [Propionibacteriaceae bacterium]HBY24388.1 bi-functional transferase/deacetylase [Propionibacteriaceae bacterium]
MTRATAPKLRAHWLLLGMFGLILATGLIVEVPARSLATTLYNVPAVGSTAKVPESVMDGGPGVGLTGTTLKTLSPAAKTIALTFDDGPDPEWTPQILKVLSAHGVHGTFFVLGNQVIRQPDLLNQIEAQGSELGVHAFSHQDMSGAAPWQVQLQLRATQLVIGGLTGRTTSLFRPPFSSTNKVLDDASLQTVEVAGAEGYLTVLTTVDSEDWKRPGVAKIVANATPPTGTTGQIIVFHDAGGDRSQTVAALDQLIPKLQAAGYTLTTVDKALGLTKASVPSPPSNQLFGWLLAHLLWLATSLVGGIGWVMLGAGVLTLLRAALVVWSASRHVRRPEPAGAPPSEPVTVIVPAYNESAGIEAAVRSLLASTHPVEVVVVDDGSTDGTADLVEKLALPGVRVIRQENAGKPAALNTGIAVASHEIVVMVDGDTVFEPTTIANLIKPFADPGVGAVSGNAKVANRGGLLGRWQHIEYVVGFNTDRRWYDIAGCMATVPGAVGGFRREALRAVGGVSSDTLAEDTDLTMALGRAGWHISYRQDAIAWTEAPATVNALWRQRYRWSYGTMQAMWKHRAGLRQRGRGGTYTRRAFTYMTLFQVLLPLLAPAVDVFAVYGVLALDPVRALTVWGAFQLVDLAVALYAFRLDKESPRPLWALPLTQFCYRQLLYLVVIQSVATAVAGVRLGWQRVERYGTFGASTSS